MKYHSRILGNVCKSLLAVAFCVSGIAVAADKSSGKKLYHQLGCFGCHGDKGGSKLNDYPPLSGRTATFVASELNKYRNELRKDPTMNAMAVGLSDKDIEDIAAYISKN